MTRRRTSPVVRGSIAGLVVAAMLLLAVLVPTLVFRARTGEHTAEFANAAGLSSGTPVQVAGVPAGRVTEVALAGDRVRVTFRLDDGQRLGERTRAAIKIRTLLGTRYLQVDPAGPGRSSEPIPRERTSVPYSLDEIARGSTGTAAELDVAALQRMIGVVQETAPDDPQLTGDALTGISAASRVLGERGDQVRELLRGTQSLTDSLLQQQDSLVSILGDAKLIADALAQRRAAIRQLISDVQEITTRLNSLLQENRAQIDPLLDDVHRLTDSLARSDRAIGESLELLGPTSRYIANATGNGPWGDVSAPAGPIPDNLLCGAGLLEGCR